MFGFKLIHEAELERIHREHELELRAKGVELAETKRRAELAESNATYWERKAEEFLDRADRQLDGYLQQNGLPQVTTTGKRESKEQQDVELQEFEKRQKELQELFSESMNTVYD